MPATRSSRARGAPRDRVEFAELLRRTRAHVAGLLEAKEREGVLRLHAPADAVADVLFARMAWRCGCSPRRTASSGPSVLAGVRAVRAPID
jgi:hypothetical protein